MSQQASQTCNKTTAIISLTIIMGLGGYAVYKNLGKVLALTNADEHGIPSSAEHVAHETLCHDHCNTGAHQSEIPATIVYGWLLTGFYHSDYASCTEEDFYHDHDLIELEDENFYQNLLNKLSEWETQRSLTTNGYKNTLTEMKEYVRFLDINLNEIQQCLDDTMTEAECSNKINTVIVTGKQSVAQKKIDKQHFMGKCSGSLDQSHCWRFAHFNTGKIEEYLAEAAEIGEYQNVMQQLSQFEIIDIGYRYENDELSTMLMYDSTNKHAILLMKGTCTTQDWIRGNLDVLFETVTCSAVEDGLELYVSQGDMLAFQDSMQELHDEFVALIQSHFNDFANQPLLLTIIGHSMGGALAHIGAMNVRCKLIPELGLEQSDIKIEMVTFAAPKSIRTSSINDFEEHIVSKDDNLRFVNKGDAVPLVPPGFTGYGHAGHQVVLDFECIDALDCHKVGNYAQDVVNLYKD